MLVEQEVAENEGLTVEMHGETYYFCCEDCKEEFLENPPKYPDHCAHCMEDVNPTETLWKVRHKDRLYFFCSEECKQGFQKEEFGQVLY